MTFGKPECKHVNSECEFGPILTNKSNPTEETSRIEVNRIGFDSICEEKPTGKWVRYIKKYKVCKYCGKEILISSDKEYI